MSVPTSLATPLRPISGAPLKASVVGTLIDALAQTILYETAPLADAGVVADPLHSGVEVYVFDEEGGQILTIPQSSWFTHLHTQKQDYEDYSYDPLDVVLQGHINIDEEVVADLSQSVEFSGGLGAYDTARELTNPFNTAPIFSYALSNSTVAVVWHSIAAALWGSYAPLTAAFDEGQLGPDGTNDRWTIYGFRAGAWAAPSADLAFTPPGIGDRSLEGTGNNLTLWFPGLSPAWVEETEVDVRTRTEPRTITESDSLVLLSSSAPYRQ